MTLHQLFGARAALAAVVVLIVLAGCASGPSSGQAVEWIVSQEAAKKQLNDAGFPQYTGAM